MNTHVTAFLRALRAPFLLVVAAVTVVTMAVMTFGPPTTLTTGFGSPQPQETETAAPAAQATTDLEDVAFRVTTYEVFLSRDPFARVIPEPASAGPGPGPGQDPVPGTDPGDPTAPTAPTAPTDPTDPGEPGELPPTNGEGEGGLLVVVIDTFEEDGEPRAVVRVGNRIYEVGVGDTFADHFEVVSIDPPCVTYLYGSTSDTQCEGEAVLK